MATEEDWASYTRAVIDLAPPGGPALRLEPDDPGRTGAWPDGVAAPLVVVTAWNPDSVVLRNDDNRARHRRLVDELDRLGLPHWPATGRDPATPHHEEGVAVPGLPGELGVELGARHGQAAVYLWTPDGWTVVSCTDDRRHTSGWRLRTVPAPAT